MNIHRRQIQFHALAASILVTAGAAASPVSAGEQRAAQHAIGAIHPYAGKIAKATGRPILPDTKKQDAASPARRLLKRMLEAETSLAFTGSQVTIVYRERGPIRSEQNVFRDGSRAIRMDYTGGTRVVAGEQVVDDGTTFWRYIPKRNTLEISPSRVKTLRNRIRQMIAQVRRGVNGVQIIGEQNVAGRPCAMIDVRPVSGFGAWRRFWIDQGSGLPLRQEEYRADNSIQSVSYFETINPVSGFPPGTFAAPVTPPNVIRKNVDGPGGGTLADAQKSAPFTIRQPGYIPGGYRFQSAAVSRFRGKKMIVLQYANGLSTISIYEIAADSPSAVEPAQSPRNEVATATIAGIKVVVVGSVGSGELLRIIQSM